MSNDESNFPNAPDAQNDFNQNETNQHTVEGTHSRIVTLDEQLQLEAQRKALRAEQHLTIDGTTEQEVHQETAERLEREINYIRERREAAQQKFRDNFRRSGRSK